MTTTETQTGAYIGTSVPRKEDRALLTGRASYVDNLTVPGMLWLAVVRSPHAHARIKKIDLKAARAAEGVVAAYGGDDPARGFPRPRPRAPRGPLGTKAPRPRPCRTRVEPRGVLVPPTLATGELALFTSTQVPHILRTLSALVMGIP